MAKPGFFIIGAPKCGTTALSEYLREHPKVFVSDPKEPHFFATDFPKYRLVQTMDEYLGLFKRATDDHLAVGEASVHYLFSDEAVPAILEFEPDAKLVVMLRDPVNMVHSLHTQFLFSFNETEEDFEKAWALQDERASGRHVPKTTRVPAMLQYRSVAKYGDQSERLFSRVSRDQVLVILFDDFKKDAKSVYEQTLTFLGVPSDGRNEFPHVNVSKGHRVRLLGRFLERPPKVWTASTAFVRRMFGLDRIGLSQFLLELNKEPQPRKPLSLEMRKVLVETYREDILNLAGILDCDLSSWLELEPKAPAAAG